MDARQPCMDDKPYLTLSFSPSSEYLSVLGLLRYIPISVKNQTKIPKSHNTHEDFTVSASQKSKQMQDETIKINTFKQNTSYKLNIQFGSIQNR